VYAEKVLRKYCLIKRENQNTEVFPNSQAKTNPEILTLATEFQQTNWGMKPRQNFQSSESWK
jgi:hypothetical protein